MSKLIPKELHHTVPKPSQHPSCESSIVLDLKDLHGEPKLVACTDILKKFVVGAKQGQVALLSPIELEEAEKVQRDLAEIGIKFRFDWDNKSKTAAFRMTGELHEVPLSTWLCGIYVEIMGAVVDAAPCQRQKNFVCGGQSACRLICGRDLHPDLSLGIAIPSKRGKPGLRPSVVFEVAVTQTLIAVRQKAIKYFYETAQPYVVHTIVILNYDNLPSRSPSQDCVVTLEVWTRPGPEYLLDDCPEQSVASADEAPSDEMPALDSSSISEVSDGSANTTSSEEDTKVEWWPSEGINRMVLRDRILIYDEAKDSAGAPQERRLLLDAYDFLRVCKSKPDEEIPAEKRAIMVSLGRLCNLVRDFVQNQRRGIVEPGSSDHGSSSDNDLPVIPQEKRRRQREPLGAIAKRFKLVPEAQE